MLKLVLAATADSVNIFCWDTLIRHMFTLPGARHAEARDRRGRSALQTVLPRKIDCTTEMISMRISNF